MKSCWTDCCEICVNTSVVLTIVRQAAATVTTNIPLCIHKSYIHVYLEKYAVPIRHGFSLFGHGNSLLKKSGHPVGLTDGVTLQWIHSFLSDGLHAASHLWWSIVRNTTICTVPNLATWSLL